MLQRRQLGCRLARRCKPVRRAFQGVGPLAVQGPVKVPLLLPGAGARVALSQPL